jgi:hypothetical protein
MSDPLTQQLQGLEQEPRDYLKGFFAQIKKNASDITDIVKELNSRRKPPVRVETSSKSPSESFTEDPNLEPIQIVRKGKNISELHQELNTNLDEEEDLQHEANIRSTPSAQAAPAATQSPLKPKPNRRQHDDDFDPERTSFQVEDDEVKYGADLSSFGEQQTAAIPHTAKPPRINEDRQIYSFDARNGAKADPNLTGTDAQAILDLMSGMEGTKVPNGENLLITSKGKKLFETDAQGQIIFSIHQRQSNFDRHPINNSLNLMKDNMNNFIRTQDRIKPDLQSERKSTQTPFERLDEAIKSGDIKHSPGLNSQAERAENKLQSESLVTLRDKLQDGGVLTDGQSTITLEHQSRGISNIKLSEPGKKPVSLGKVSKTGIVTLGKEFTTERTNTVTNLIQTSQIAELEHRQQPSATPAPSTGAVPINSVNDRAPNNGTAPANGHTPNNGAAPSNGHTSTNGAISMNGHAPNNGAAPANGNVPTSTKNFVTLKDLETLNLYYKSAHYQGKPVSPGEPRKLNPLEANDRFFKQREQLVGLGKQSLNATGKTEAAQGLSYRDSFFNDFSTDGIQLSDSERADLTTANELSATNALSPDRSSKPQPLDRTADVNQTIRPSRPR